MLKSVTAQKLFPIGIAGSLVILSLLSIWKIPQWQVQPLQEQIDALKTSKQPVNPTEIAALEKSKLDAENAARTVLVQGAGGLFAAAAACIAWRNLKATQDKQITERFSKAVEQLGSDKIEVRLGGIYSLERIAKDSPADHWTIMETLSAFIREQLPLKKQEKTKQNFAQSFLQEKISKEADSLSELSIDIRAALIVIEKRNRNQDPKEARIDLSRTNFSNAFLKEFKLEGVNLSNSNLEGANLFNADLTRANLNYANLKEANLEHAKLKGALLSGANLKGARLGLANLRKANLFNANLEEADLMGADFEGAFLMCANLKEADLTEANVTEIQLEMAEM